MPSTKQMPPAVVPANTALDKQVQHLLCAISEEEGRLFLGQNTCRLEALPLKVSWAGNPPSVDWPSSLVRLNPEILLTGWSTPPLDVQWLDSEECRLRYICHLAGSIKWLVPRSFIEREGIVTNWSDIPSSSVAEQGLLLALAALRNSGQWLELIRGKAKNGNRIEWLNTLTLFRRNVGIHGFGRVARELIKILRPFDVKIRSYSHGVPKAMFDAAGVIQAETLESMFRESDVLFECEAFTPHTSGAVSADILAMLPNNAVFVNVARGGLVDEGALLREAASGRIRVALDVVTSEPVDISSPFLGLSNVVMSPHIGGPTFDQYTSCGEFAAKNIVRYTQGKPLEGIVSLEEYDRST
ncbi:MAG: hydroxyacid dehydrogenase [Opitutaceae bacterium]|nr:hydroxyacid dehydrogenase [Opitutaceae bacterium]